MDLDFYFNESSSIIKKAKFDLLEEVVIELNVSTALHINPLIMRLDQLIMNTPPYAVSFMMRYECK